MPLPSDIIINKFNHEATQGQLSVFRQVDRFLDDDGPEILILTGYAGTGKTTVIGALTKVLPLFNYKFVLLAPTGRAAKVISSYSKRMAFTIHKRIYKQAAADGGAPRFKKQKNYAKRTVFIVDEASMISQPTGFSSGLLTDLVNYIFQDNTNKLMLVGDGAQLPPVGQLLSPAIDVDFLKNNFKYEVLSSGLTEVTRQAEDSGILFNATRLRNLLKEDDPKIGLITNKHGDVFHMTGQRMEEGLRYAYDKYGIENTTIICRSNKSANNYNQYIRRQVHYFENEIEVGEILMIVRNNYVHTPDEVAGNFLANGDFVEIRKILSFEDRYGLRFATLDLKLVDYPTETTFEAKVILDTLHEETPSLSEGKNRKLYELVKEEYSGLATEKDKREAIRKDPYLNALQIKFAYAITCHKSQGGQWNAVFVDQGFLKVDEIDQDFIRWLYTAVTRATDVLFLVNFDKQLFVN